MLVLKNGWKANVITFRYGAHKLTAAIYDRKNYARVQNLQNQCGSKIYKVPWNTAVEVGSRM